MGMTVDNAKMQTAKQNIDTMAGKFKTAGDTLLDELNTVLATFKGATKDALMASKIGKKDAGAEGQLAYFVQEQLPSMITSLANLLEGNRKTIVESDQKLADAIQGNTSS